MKETCPSCQGFGEWETECCSGAGGCDCRGERVPMGMCNVCNGTGEVSEDADLMANCKAISGLSFIGAGPSSGMWATMGRRGHLI